MPVRSFRGRIACAALACCILLLLNGMDRPLPPPKPKAIWPVTADISVTGALIDSGSGHIPMPHNTPAAHSSSLLAMPASHPSSLVAFWFAGERESAADVQIAAAQFDRVLQKWSAARFVVNRKALSEVLGYGVRRLGNPVAWLDNYGRIHLFVVATGLGGWAAARIVHLRQSNEHQDFSAMSFDVMRVLPMSWWWNTSFLVRTAPLPLQDGGMILPVHFELGMKYPAILRFDASGEYLGMVRISSRKHLLQPTLMMLSESHWIALMRIQNPAIKVAVAETSDGGRNWTDLSDLKLDNPGSSLAGLSLASGTMFLAHNSSPHSRSALDLSASVDGREWMLAKMLARGAGSDEYSYPALTWADNSLWVSYTDQRQRIAWQRFTFAATAR